MGIEPFLVSSALVGVIAQRLVRKLCSECKEEYIPDAIEKDALEVREDINIFKPVGCEYCNNTGYKGRIAVYEIMTITKKLKDMIAANSNSNVLKQTALSEGMITLRANCMRLVKEGITSVEEMLRVTYVKD
jgi:type IV pilus assembly protein PilB